MIKTYLIKLVNELDKNCPNDNDHYYNEMGNWVSLPSYATRYDKDDAIKQMGILLHEQKQVSQLVREKDLPSPQKLEAIKVFDNLKAMGDSRNLYPVELLNNWMIEEAHLLWDKGDISHEVFARVVSKILGF